MRKILFRGKYIYKDVWHEGFLFKKSDDCDVMCISREPLSANDYSEILGDYVEVIPETVGQYTGLTDKNGTKIFEGDIVEFSKNTYQISFESGSFILLDRQGEMISKIGGENDHCYSLFDLSLDCCWEDDWAVDIEVLGNIHDNKLEDFGNGN